MADRPDPAAAPQGEGKAPPKPAGRGFGRTLLEVLIAFVFIVVAGSVVSYSVRVGRPPWSWSGDDWQGYLSFSQEKVEKARARVEQVDWANVKTRITENTKSLWDGAPDVLQKLEERLGIAKKPAGSPDPSAPAAATAGDPPELQLGLAALKAGIQHYRASPTDQAELLAAKKCFEEAQGHLEKAVTQVQGERQRAEVQDDLRTCNKYLEDCRSREKS